jgi:hypothetical protein
MASTICFLKVKYNQSINSERRCEHGKEEEEEEEKKLVFTYDDNPSSTRIINFHFFSFLRFLLETVNLFIVLSFI